MSKYTLSKLDRNELLTNTRALVAEERKITLNLIEHLREIERRMLFAELGYGSLFEFCQKHLGMSEGSAHRRISAMRLAHEVPELKAKLASGEVSLSNAAKLHATFKASKKSLNLEDKKKILEDVSGLSQKECEAKLFQALPQAMGELNRERERVIGQDATELRLVLTDEIKAKLQRIRELHSHKIPDGSTLKILEFLLDEEIRRLEKKKGLDRAENPTDTLQVTSAAEDFETKRSSTKTFRRSSIPAAIRKQVWARAKGRCEFEGCSSRYQLEIDHRTPKALGGRDSHENLRLLCRQHNAQQAFLALGSLAMAPFLPRLR